MVLPKSFYESSEYIAKRENVQAEINKNKLQIDRTVFVHTEEEKILLKQLRKKFKHHFN